MALEFIFAKHEHTKWDALHQGDVLRKTRELAAALSQAHAYYAEATDYTHFMVLTQSCDLVSRGTQPPKSRYITLAAGRPLGVYIKRLLEKNKHSLEFPIPIFKKRIERSARQSLERLLHNTEDGYFFLRAGSHPNIDVDVCIFLPLSITLRVNHYQTCVSAKIAQLDHVFQAKVGWLTGNIYSRVGTPDLEEKENNAEEVKSAFFEDVLFKESAWLTDDQWKILKKKIAEWKESHEVDEITEDNLETLIAQIPESVDMVAQRAITLLMSNKMLIDEPSVKEKAINILQNDKPFRRLIKNADV